MSGTLSRRGGAVDPFIVMDVMAAAAEKEAAGDTVIHLEVGQPSTPAPKGALAAAHAALDSDRIGYVAALGIPALRERIARHYREAYQTEVSHERVIVTTGSSGGFPLAFLASFDAGDRVALAAPGYPAYRNILTALNLEAVDLPTSAADLFQPTAATLPRLSQHPAAAQSRTRPPADLGRRPLPADRRGAEEGGTHRRPDRGEPVQPHRHHGGPRRDEGIGRLVRRERRAIDLRRDLSRHRLRGRHGVGGRGVGRRHRRQQLLEILLDDRLARRLAGGAAGAGAADRAAGAEL